MTRGYLLNRSFDRRWRLVAVLLVAIGQLGIVSAALTLARDESSVVSHTEESGTNLHHGHNEATCPACIALSFHSAPRSSAAPAFFEIVCRSVAEVGATFCITGAQLLPDSCRAPPREA
jgi:hypothetical protein